MSGAVHGRVRVPASPYPEFVNPESMPAGEQELFVAAFEALLAKRAEPLTRQEYQLAWLVGREMWRECYYACAEARRAEMLLEIEDGTGTLSDGVRVAPGQVLAHVESRVPGGPAAGGRRRA